MPESETTDVNPFEAPETRSIETNRPSTGAILAMLIAAGAAAVLAFFVSCYGTLWISSGVTDMYESLIVAFIVGLVCSGAAGVLTFRRFYRQQSRAVERKSRSVT